MSTKENKENDGVSSLIFSKKAWDKLVYMRDIGKTEIGGWGVTSDKDEFFVEDFITVKQKTTSVTVEFDDEDNNRFATEMLIKNSKSHKNTQKVWIHTHPGNSPNPSGVDEDTLKKMTNNLSENDYVIMFILAKDDSVYCRLALKTKFGILSKTLDCLVESETNIEWNNEYDLNVKEIISAPIKLGKPFSFGSSGCIPKYDLDELDKREDDFLKERFGMLVNDDIPEDKIPTGPSLEPEDMPEELYLKYNVWAVKWLTKDQKKDLKKRYGKSITMYLDGLEQAFSDTEIVTAKDIEDMYEEFGVKALSELKHEQWRKILRNWHVRRQAALKAEEKYISQGLLDIHEEKFQELTTSHGVI